MLFSFKKKAASKPASMAAAKPVKKKPVKKSLFAVLWIDEKWVKVVLAKGKPGRAVIETVLAFAIEGREDESVAEELKRALAERAPETLPVFVTHPAHLSRSRFLRLPSTDPKELAVMVDLQVEKHTPDSKEDTLTYHKRLHSDTEGYSHIFLVMTHQDRVSRSVRIAQRVFAELRGVSTDVDGLGQWMNQQGEPEDNGTVLIDLDHDYAALLVLHEGQVCFHRSIAANREAVLANPQGAEAQQLFGELHRSIMAYDEEGLKSACKRVHIIGEPVPLGAIAEQMRKELNLPVTVVPSQTGFELTSDALDALCRFSGTSFAGLFGILGPGTHGDLTPASVKMRRLSHQKVTTVSVLAGQILCGVLLIMGFLFYSVHQDMKYALYLESKNNQIEAPARELEVSIEHLKVVRSRIEKRGVMLDAMTSIAQVTSPEIRWTGLTYDEAEGIVIKGVSAAMANVSEMVAVLEKNEYFAKPEARRVTKRKVDGQDVTDFEIVLPLAGMEAGDDETA